MKRYAFIAIALLAALSFAVLDADIVFGIQDTDSETCMMCHADADMVDEEYLVDQQHFAGTPHSEEEMGIGCVDCHVQAADVEDIYEHGPLGPASCDDCHGDVNEMLAMGMHAPEGKGVPSCADCHGEGHNISYVSEETSPSYRTNQPDTCRKCHNGDVIDHFLKSIHGVKLMEGAPDGPTCSTCHDAHTSVKADITRNPQYKLDITAVCGDCHVEAMNEYAPSIHGTMLLQEGAVESASCVDCHSSHDVLPPAEEGSTVHPLAIVDSCADCHSDSTLIRRFGLQSDVVATYENSYHGQALDFGQAQSANCESCHTHHKVYPMDDPRSSVHPSNLKQTCGECHPSANENFIQGKIHVELASEENNFAAWVVKNLYIWLIIAVIGGMIIHNIFDFVRKMMNKAKRQKAQPHIIRMNGLERFLHASLAISFLLLVYTGFALLFPDAWWVAPINMLDGSELFRGWLHRVCGLILTAVAFHHLWFMFFHKRGIEQRRHFTPRLRDLRDIWDNILWFFGKRKERPKFGRFSYMEKAEYWALVWGTGVMVLTGFMLWFQEFTLLFVPRWLWEVALVIHLFEAILAGLAILVWHFYYVMVNPDEAPLSLTFITGRMTLEELSHVHPEEFEEVMAERAKAEQQDEKATEVSPDSADEEKA